jgi:hypothetical protein
VTTQATNPSEGVAKLVMTIDEPFTTDLQNPQSEEFINMASRFRSFLIPLYQNETWFIDITVNSFSNGSIIADIDVLYNITEATPTVEEFQAPIIEAKNNGSAPFTIRTLTVTISANTTATTAATTASTTNVTTASTTNVTAPNTTAVTTNVTILGTTAAATNATTAATTVAITNATAPDTTPSTTDMTTAGTTSATANVTTPGITAAITTTTVGTSAGTSSATTQTTIPSEGAAKLVMTIDEPFITDLQNPQSEAFINMTSRFRSFLISLYQNETWFIDIMVNSFSNGSIIADIDVLYNTTEATPTVEDIRAPIIAAINNGSAPFAIQNLTVTFSANTTATTPGTTGATTSVTEKSNEGDDDGFETWEIALVVSLAVVLLVLVLVSTLVSIHVIYTIFSRVTLSRGY